MKQKKIEGSTWDEVLGVHRLFKTINESVVRDYGNVTPLDILKLIFDPSGIKCDGLTTVYQRPGSGKGYFVRLEHVEGETAYHIDPETMPRGEGGFLRHMTTLTEPRLFPDIRGEVTNKDLEVLPWLSRMRTALAVPTIGVTGEPATTILFGLEEGAFGREEVLRSVILINAMTNILLNVLLRKETEKVCGVLDRELESIGRIQREFLPKELPCVKGFDWAVYYATSTRAGGDYYDFFVLPDDQIGIIIADVAGHGSPAAVVMAMTRLLLHTYPREARPPVEVLGNVNRLLIGNLLPGQFVTAFYCILDQRTNTITYSNAGHCHPQLFSSADRSISEVTTERGLPLGVSVDGGFEQGTLELGKGDVLVLYTDGLREAMNKNKELYGETRLRNILKASYMRPAEEIKNSILGDVMTFCDGEPIRDDLTIVVLKVTE